MPLVNVTLTTFKLSIPAKCYAINLHHHQHHVALLESKRVSSLHHVATVDIYLSGLIPSPPSSPCAGSRRLSSRTSLSTRPMWHGPAIEWQLDLVLVRFGRRISPRNHALKNVAAIASLDKTYVDPNCLLEYTPVLACHFSCL